MNIKYSPATEPRDRVSPKDISERDKAIRKMTADVNEVLLSYQSEFEKLSKLLFDEQGIIYTPTIPPQGGIE